MNMQVIQKEIVDTAKSLTIEERKRVLQEIEIIQKEVHTKKVAEVVGNK